MNVAFLHGEFFVWMLLPVAVLFYFWMTQKPINEHGLRDEIVKRLRAPATTLGLKERNGLFLAASLFIIIALADPVMLSQEREAKDLKTVIAIDISTKTKEAFEQQKALVQESLKVMKGSIALVAYDTEVYYVAPMSEDRALLSELIDELSYKTLQKSTSDGAKVMEKFSIERKEGMALIIVGDARGGVERERVYFLCQIDDVARIKEAIATEKRENKDYASAIPLFYYPLGMAMILIAIALFSMSKRQKVMLASILFVFLAEKDVRAGMLEFTTLRDAYEAYERQEYQRSAQLFSIYKEDHDTPEIRYNYANALLMAGHYEQARYWYGKVHTEDPRLQRYVRHNLAAIPLQKGENAPLPKREKSRLKESSDRKQKGEKIFIRNATPLFVYD